MIAVINSGLANISSVVFALERLGVQAVKTTDPQVIKRASHVILPGVGTANHAMQNLKELNLISVIQNLKQPVLGICLGMQLLYDYSEEGDVACLGIFPGKIRLLKGDNLIVPHMGWNTLSLRKESNLLKKVKEQSYVYFVHSYYAPVGACTVAVTHYGQDISAIVQKDNFYAMQFHPERSGSVGEQLLKNFVEI